eukprot:s2970_g2.t1
MDHHLKIEDDMGMPGVMRNPGETPNQGFTPQPFSNPDVPIEEIVTPDDDDPSLGNDPTSEPIRAQRKRREFAVDSSDALPKAKAKVIIKRPKVQLQGHVQPIEVPVPKDDCSEEDDVPSHDPQASSSNDPSIPLPTTTPTSFMPGEFAQQEPQQNSQGTEELISSHDDDQTQPYETDDTPVLTEEEIAQLQEEDVDTEPYQSDHSHFVDFDGTVFVPLVPKLNAAPDFGSCDVTGFKQFEQYLAKNGKKQPKAESVITQEVLRKYAKEIKQAKLEDFRSFLDFIAMAFRDEAQVWKKKLKFLLQSSYLHEIVEELLEHFMDPVNGSNAKGRKPIGMCCLHVDNLFIDLFITGTPDFPEKFKKVPDIDDDRYYREIGSSCVGEDVPGVDGRVRGVEPRRALCCELGVERKGPVLWSLFGKEGPCVVSLAWKGRALCCGACWRGRALCGEIGVERESPVLWSLFGKEGPCVVSLVWKGRALCCGACWKGRALCCELDVERKSPEGPCAVELVWKGRPCVVSLVWKGRALCCGACWKGRALCCELGVERKSPVLWNLFGKEGPCVVSLVWKGRALCCGACWKGRALCCKLGVERKSPVLRSLFGKEGPCVVSLVWKGKALCCGACWKGRALCCELGMDGKSPVLCSLFGKELGVARTSPVLWSLFGKEGPCVVSLVWKGRALCCGA